MRLMLASAVSAVAAQDFSDAQLAAYARALDGVRAAQDGAGQVAAIEAEGLSIEDFNGISEASQDPVVRARIAVAAAEPSAPGSVGAGVSDAEVDQYADAIPQVRAIVEAAAGNLTDDHRREMVSAIEGVGLTPARFNEIGGAVAYDAHLRARVELAAIEEGV